MKKTAYRLTAAIGDLKRGAVIELDEQKAASPLYASRITPAETLDGLTVTVDVEAIRAEILEGLKAEGEKIVSDAQAEAKKIIEAAQAEAMKLAANAGKK